MAAFHKYKYYLLTMVVALLYVAAQSRFTHGDFRVFLSAADYLRHGQNPYKVWLIWKGEITDQYAYGPAFAALLIPLSMTTEQVAFILFFSIQFVLLVRAFVITKNMLPIDRLSNRQQLLWWLLVILCSLRFILHNVEFGQITILMLYLSIEGLYQIFYGNKALGSFLLAFAIHTKILPLVFIPYLIWRKEFSSVAICMGLFLLLWLTPFAFGDVTFAHRLFTDWCSTVSPFNPKFVQHQEQQSFQMQGLSALLSAYLLNSGFEKLDFKINITVLSQPVFLAILQLSRLVLILFTLYFLKGSFFRPYSKNSQGFWQLAYLFLVIPLIFPQQQKYSMLLMTPFFGYMCWWIIAASENRSKRWKMVVTCFAFIILLTTFTSDLFVGMRLNYIFQCMRILTMAMLLAIPLLALVPPDLDTGSR